MKTITIPSPVMLKNSDGLPSLDAEGRTVTITFQSFVINVLLTDPKFGKGMLDILSAVDIKQKLSSATSELELDNADYDRLKTAAVEPTAPYNPVVVIQLAEFLTAIRDAK